MVDFRPIGISIQQVSQDSISEESQTNHTPIKRKSLPEILVVDDEPLNIEVMTIMLEAKGYASDCVTKGLQALEIVK